MVTWYNRRLPSVLNMILKLSDTRIIIIIQKLLNSPYLSRKRLTFSRPIKSTYSIYIFPLFPQRGKGGGRRPGVTAPYKKIRCYDGNGDENVKKAIGFITKTSTLLVHHTQSGTFLCCHCMTAT